MRLHDMLYAERFDIAEELGIPIDRDWTDEEIERIIAECDRRHRPFLLSLIEDDPQE